VPGLGLAVGRGAGALSSWVWAKEGAAKATAAKAAMLAINRRISYFSRAAGGGDGCGLIVEQKYYEISATYVNFLIDYKNCN
jgi:hypothetical protein